METYGVSQIFSNTAYVMLVVGILSAIFISRFEMRKAKSSLMTQNS